MEFLEFVFGYEMGSDSNNKVRFSGQILKRVDKFKYLGSFG